MKALRHFVGDLIRSLSCHKVFGLLALLFAFHVVANVWWLKEDNHPLGMDETAHLRHTNTYYQAICSIAFGASGEYGAESSEPWAKKGLLDVVIKLSQVDSTFYPPLLYYLGSGAALLAGFNQDVVAFTGTIAFVLLLIGIYKFSRIFLGQVEALFVTFVTSFLPALYCSSRLILQDLPTATLVVWTCWALYKTDNFKRNGWVFLFAILVGLGFLMRWLTILYCVAPTAYVVLSGISKTISWKDKRISDPNALRTICLNIAMAVVVAGGIFAPWYLLNLKRLTWEWKYHYTRATYVAPPPGLFSWFRWSKLSVFLINKGVFLPTFVIAVLGMAVALRRCRRERILLFTLVWFLGSYLTLVAFYGWKSLSPGYVIQMIPPLAVFVYLALSAIPRARWRRLAMALFSSLLLFQYGNLTFVSFGPFARLELPLYSYSSHVPTVPNEGAVVYSDSIIWGHRGDSSPPYRGENWVDRIFRVMAKTELETAHFGTIATIRNVRPHRRLVERAVERYWPLAHPLANDDVRVEEPVGPFQSIGTRRPRPSVKTLLNLGDQHSELIPSPLFRKADEAPVVIPVPSELEMVFDSVQSLNAISMVFADELSSPDEYVLQYFDKDAGGYEDFSPPIHCRDAHLTYHFRQFNAIQTDRLRLRMLRADPRVSDVALNSIDLFQYERQVRPYMCARTILYTATGIEFTIDPATVPNTEYFVVDGGLTAQEERILNGDFELLDQFTANLRTHWQPATLSIYGRKAPPIISFGTEPAFQVSVTGDMTPEGRWDAPWWYPGLPGPETHEFWATCVPAMADVSLGDFYNISHIYFIPYSKGYGLSSVLLQYWDSVAGFWKTVEREMYSIHAVKERLDQDTAHFICTNRLRFSFLEGGPRREDIEKTYIKHIIIYGERAENPRGGIECRDRIDGIFAQQAIDAVAAVYDPSAETTPAAEPQRAPRDRVYEVGLQDTIYDIVATHDITVQQLMAWNSLERKPSIGAGDLLYVSRPSVPYYPAVGELHQVRRGETLLDIAALYDVTAYDLIDWNKLGDRPEIHEGDFLFVSEPVVNVVPPPGAVHEVQPRETLADIAKQCSVSMQELVAWNGLSSLEDIEEGDILYLSRPANLAGLPGGMYEVKEGETLRDVAQRFRVTVPQLLAWNSLGVRPQIGKDTALFVSKPHQYVGDLQERLCEVREGDTLRDIAKRTSTTVQQLIAWNGLLEDRRIRPGEVLYVSRPTFPFILPDTLYEVREDDTLPGIAAAHDITLQQLAAWNGLSKRLSCRKGDVLFVVKPATTVAKRRVWLHEVAPGEALIDIAIRYHVSIQQLIGWNDLGMNPVIKEGDILYISMPPELDKTPAPDTYEVQTGDTAAQIAASHNITLEQLAEWNSLSNKLTLRVGDRLVVSKPYTLYDPQSSGLHEVGDGETLSDIARDNDILLSQLIEWNGLVGTPGIFPGDMLFVSPPPAALGQLAGPSNAPQGAARTGKVYLYQVKWGDDLQSIAVKFGLTVQQLLGYNNLSLNTILQVGGTLAVSRPMDLTLPPGMYEVRANETLHDVAARHRVMVQQLLAWNSLPKRPNVLDGTVLFVARPPRPLAPLQNWLYEAQTGETLEEIAIRNRVTVEQLKVWNALDDTAHLHAGDYLYTECPGMWVRPPAEIYKVEQGDTLATIANRHGVSVAQLAQWNGLADSSDLRTGDLLYLSAAIYPRSPPGRWLYQVKSGDTLIEIAQAHEISVGQLLQWNGLSLTSPIQAGDVLALTSPLEAYAPVHTVRERETRDDIAGVCEVTVQQLLAWNNLSALEAPQVGTTLHAARPLELPAIPEGLHEVQTGDTLHSVAERYGISIQQLFAWNALDPEIRLEEGTVLFVSKPARPLVPWPSWLYKVRPGDTLYRVAVKNRITVQQILAWNGLEEDAQLKAGDVLFIAHHSVPIRPGEQSHTVKWSESIYTIAKRYGTTVNQLQAWNNLPDYASISDGDLLYVSEPLVAANPPGIQFHTVGLEEDLTYVAVLYQVHPDALIEWNQLDPSGAVREGQQLVVSSPLATEDAQSSVDSILARLASKPVITPHRVAFAANVTEQQSPLTDVILLGDTLATIAGRNGILIEQLGEWNALDEASTCRVGDPLIVSDPSRPVSPLAQYERALQGKYTRSVALQACMSDANSPTLFEFGASSMGNGTLELFLNGDRVLLLPATPQGESFWNQDALRVAEVSVDRRLGDLAADEFAETGRLERAETPVEEDTDALEPADVENGAGTGDVGGEAIFRKATARSEKDLVQLAFKLTGDSKQAQGIYRLVIPASLVKPRRPITMGWKMTADNPHSGFVLEGFPALSKPALTLDLGGTELGLYLAVIDPVSGKVIDCCVFNPYLPFEGARCADYLRALPDGAIVAGVVYDDAMFRGLAWVDALREDFGADIPRSPEWDTMKITPLYRSSFVCVAVKGAPPKAGWIKRSLAKRIVLSLRKGQQIPGTNLDLPLDVHLVSGGAYAGPEAHLWVAPSAMAYQRILLSQEQISATQSQELIRVVVDLDRYYRVGKIRLSGANPFEGASRYTVRAWDEEKDAFTDCDPPIHFSGDPGSARFYEIKPRLTSRILIDVTKGGERGLNLTEIALFARVEESAHGPMN